MVDCNGSRSEEGGKEEEEEKEDKNVSQHLSTCKKKDVISALVPRVL